MDLIDLSAVPEAEDNFTAFLDELCDKLEFDYASYATTHPITGDVQGYANYPEQWKFHYMKQGMHRFDPTIYQSVRSIAPVDWSRFADDEKFRAVFYDARDFGITNRGLTVPVRGPYGECGLLSVTRDCSETDWKKLKREVIGELQFAAVHMHDNVMRSGVLHSALRRPTLSSRELQILQWTAAGKSQQDIGDILSISHRTVEVHLRSGREKLSALTTAQAVGRAIGLGLIYPA
ncbi:autoinducer binding domain-containing protein [Pseudodonghicola xiamenensis]|uniref:LuxR family transcriptional regulator n=1 Tax=Pseudodonghicola xiamenensis TaxID=337702 RepID=A0A8J3H4W2_9RHOB|nr:autoinducer binding domain-containing protein [Pseudodonghicola xiamenensis]GHG79727.1 LuxR family transcriptional regulator [Pseudodonghicola xiamenensis]